MGFWVEKNKIKQGPEQTATTVGKMKDWNGKWVWGMGYGVWDMGYGWCSKTNIESGIKKNFTSADFIAMNLRSNGKSMCFPTDSQFYSDPLQHS